MYMWNILCHGVITDSGGEIVKSSDMIHIYVLIAQRLCKYNVKASFGIMITELR